jgi:puromycin-sensitive aminopeptidase
MCRQIFYLLPWCRLNVLDDVYSLVAAGQLPSVEFMRFLQAYQTETSYVVWSKISDILATLRCLLVDLPCFPQFNVYVCHLFSKIRHEFSWEKQLGESHLSTLHRSLVISWLGRAGDPAIRNEAKRRFDLHASGKQTIDADLRYAWSAVPFLIHYTIQLG